MLPSDLLLVRRRLADPQVQRQPFTQSPRQINQLHGCTPNQRTTSSWPLLGSSCLIQCQLGQIRGAHEPSLVAPTLTAISKVPSRCTDEGGLTM